MTIFYAIVAMSENRVIGEQNKIPWHLPEDYRWFKHKTMGGTLIMGRKTYDSIGESLPGRETVVLTRSQMAANVRTCSDVSTLYPLLSALPKPCWICGGVQIYRQFLRNCQLLYLTRVKSIVAGDAFFPPFEDKFEFDQTIHENQHFRVERWRLLFPPEPVVLEPEPWPFERPQ